MEDSRIDSTESISTRIPVAKKPIDSEEHHKNNASEDENEIDLRERLLREKAIKSMKRRQSSSNNNANINAKITTDRIVYETQ